MKGADCLSCARVRPGDFCPSCGREGAHADSPARPSFATSCPDCGEERPPEADACPVCRHDYALGLSFDPSRMAWPASSPPLALPAPRGLRIVAAVDAEAARRAGATMEGGSVLSRGVGAGTLRVGRGSRYAFNDEEGRLLLADPGVSRRHGEFGMGAEGLRFADLGSSNGTLLDGRPLAPGEFVALRPGSRLCVGAWTVLFIEEDAT